MSEVQEIPIIWAAVPLTYEKWVHPANKNDKHYRMIFRNNKGDRRISNRKFKTATLALAYIDRIQPKLCPGRNNASGSGNNI